MDSIMNHARRIRRPVRAVQFGEGNFLRAFADYMLDIAAEKGAFDGSIAVVKPRSGGSLAAFREQDCLYTVLLRGRENGEVIDSARLITVLNSVRSPYEEPGLLHELACTETLEFILSNTTEAGIALTGSEQMDDMPCESFPGKLTQLLYARYRHFSGRADKGLVILPAELIENNGGKLKNCVLSLAGKWNLEKGFVEWINEACLFANTLVDRIVTGRPADAEALASRLGYEDKLAAAGEPFALWVIECPDPEALSARLPLDKIGLPAVYTKDLTPYRERKVRILNGAHTSSVLAAFLAGEDIVRGMMNSPLTRPLVDRAVYGELLPTVNLPADEVRAFADAVMERFDNPFIDHRLLDISLNSVSKWRARVLPSVRDTVREKGSLPEALIFSLAALIAFYTPASREGNQLFGQRSGESYPIRDDLAVLDFFWNNRERTFTPGFVRELAACADFWGEDLNKIPGLTDCCAKWLHIIKAQSMQAAIRLVTEE